MSNANNNSLAGIVMHRTKAFPIPKSVDEGIQLPVRTQQTKKTCGVKKICGVTVKRTLGTYM